jgi:hypothetical protein
MPTAALALGLFFTLPSIDAAIDTVGSFVPAAIGNLSLVSPAMGQPGALTKKQSQTLKTFNDAINDFATILGRRRAEINANPPDPADPRVPADITDHDAGRVIVIGKRLSSGVTRIARWDERHKYYNDELTLTAL